MRGAPSGRLRLRSATRAVSTSTGASRNRSSTADAVLARPRPAQVTLPALPHAALVDHRQPSQHEALGQLPLEALDRDARVLVVDVEPECDEPLVGAHPHRSLRRELLGQRGLAGARQPAEEDQPSAHARTVRTLDAPPDRIEGVATVGCV